MTRMNPTRVLIADRHLIVRKGLQMLLSTEPSIQVIGEAEDIRDVVQKAKSLKPDVILMDLVTLQGDGFQAIAEIKSCIAAKIIILTMFHDETIINAAIEAGVDGYLLKDADDGELIRAIRAVQEGGMAFHPVVARHLASKAARFKGTDDRGLTKREEEVLRLVANGMNTRAIARALTIEEGTARLHIHNILRKLDVSSRTGAAVWAAHMGLLIPDGKA